MNCLLEGKSNLIVKKSCVSGKVTATPSKSFAHRLILLAALTKGRFIIENISYSKDILATVGAIKALGVKVIENDKSLIIENDGQYLDNVEIDCFESGSTLRFIIPIIYALNKTATLIGRGKLVSRTYEDLYKALSNKGLKFSNKQGLPLTIKTEYVENIFEINGDVSSQYITGLLLALYYIGEGKIKLTSKLVSKPYVDITIETLKLFGAIVKIENDTIYLKVENKISEGKFRVEGDFSNASYFMCLGAINGNIEIDGLNFNSTQGDKKFIQVLDKFGVKYEIKNDSILVMKSLLKSGLTIDINDMIDLAPSIAVLMAVSGGGTLLSTSRLKLKESDRAEALRYNLERLGVEIFIEKDSIIIGKSNFKSAKLSSFNDHRIAMSMCVLSTLIGDVEIEEFNSINKSYKDFLIDFSKVGGKFNVISLGK